MDFPAIWSLIGFSRILSVSQQFCEINSETVVPTVRGLAGPYRFFFYSFDRNEPKHVHVQRERSICKFWLEPLVLAGNDGFAPHELTRIRKILLNHIGKITEAWEEHCGHE